MLRSLVKGLNPFPFENFLKSQGRKAYSSIFGGLLTLTLLSLVCILGALKVIQLTTYGISTVSSQTNYNLQPLSTSLSTNMSDQSSAPFMLAFNIELDASSCPNSKIIFQGFFKETTRSNNSSSGQNLSKIPMVFQTCTDYHFSMLPGMLKKINRLNSNSLYCLKLNSYFQIVGAEKLSQIYKNIQYAFTCPSTCSQSVCGYVELFSASAKVNLHNATQPYSYQLTRHRFSIEAVPKYQISYLIESSNLTTDQSIFPFARDRLSRSASVGNVISDIPAVAGDPKNYITVEASDKSTIHLRSYYKIFDLFAYMGGIIYGLFLLLIFVRYTSKMQFEINFAAEYLRKADYKITSLLSFLAQIFYGIARHTRVMSGCTIQRQREDSRQVVNRVLDVLYLNKRIVYLQKAISLIFQHHQLKAIHLLPTHSREEVRNKFQNHKFRDRLVYFLGQKYKNQQIARPSHQQQFEINSASPKKSGVESVQRLSSPDKEEQIQTEKPALLNLRALISRRSMEEYKQPQSSIIHEAEQYYQVLAQSRKKSLSINNAQNNHKLRNELQIVGPMTQDQLNKALLVQEIQHDIKRLVRQGQDVQGHQLSKKIYSKLEDWLKNYIRDTIEQNLE